jgi:hypothetical protein
MRRLLLLGLAFIALADRAAAQVPTAGNIFVGYSYYSTDLSPIGRSNANGWEGSLEGRVFPFVGIVADFSGHYGSQNFPIVCPVGLGPCIFSANVAEHDFLFGPRFSVSVRKFRPFAEAMFGVGRVNANAAGSDTSFAAALGGGFDYRINRVITWRFEGDPVLTRFFHTSQTNVRLSTGIVIRF